MTSYLLDTNVLSELVRPRPSREVRAFLLAQADVWLSTVTIHELNYGAERAPNPDQKIKLLAWLQDIVAKFGPRIIPFDTGIARQSGQLRALADLAGHNADPLDAMIAATAMRHGLHVATRNTKHFAIFGVTLRDPWLGA